MENIGQVISGLNVILRYMASGMVANLVLLFVGSQHYAWFSWSDINEHNGIVIIATSVVVGFLIYSIHKSLLDRKFYKVSIMNYVENTELPAALVNQINLHENFLKRVRQQTRFKQRIKSLISFRKMDMIPIYDEICTSEGFDVKKMNDRSVFDCKRILNEKLVFELYTQAFLRGGVIGNDPKLNAIEKRMEDRYAMLAFLYCVSYIMIVLPLLVFFAYLYKVEFSAETIQGHSCLQFNELTFKLLFVFSSGLFILLFLCSRLSYRCLRREMWIVEHYWIGV
jgi:hypothetical protein